MDDESVAIGSESFVEEVGRRLRAIRRQQHLSLEDVKESIAELVHYRKTVFK